MEKVGHWAILLFICFFFSLAPKVRSGERTLMFNEIKPEHSQLYFRIQIEEKPGLSNYYYFYAYGHMGAVWLNRF